MGFMNIFKKVSSEVSRAMDVGLPSYFSEINEMREIENSVRELNADSDRRLGRYELHDSDIYYRNSFGRERLGTIRRSGSSGPEFVPAYAPRVVYDKGEEKKVYSTHFAENSDRIGAIIKKLSKKNEPDTVETESTEVVNCVPEQPKYEHYITAKPVTAPVKPAEPARTETRKASSIFFKGLIKRTESRESLILKSVKGQGLEVKGLEVYGRDNLGNIEHVGYLRGGTFTGGGLPYFAPVYAPYSSERRGNDFITRYKTLLGEVNDTRVNSAVEFSRSYNKVWGIEDGRKIVIREPARQTVPQGQPQPAFEHVVSDRFSHEQKYADVGDSE